MHAPKAFLQVDESNRVDFLSCLHFSQGADTSWLFSPLCLVKTETYKASTLCGLKIQGRGSGFNSGHRIPGRSGTEQWSVLSCTARRFLIACDHFSRETHEGVEYTNGCVCTREVTLVFEASAHTQLSLES